MTGERVSVHRIVSHDHALVAGAVWGLAAVHGLELAPLLDADGDFSAECELVLPGDAGFLAGVRVSFVVMPPTIEGKP